MTPYKRKSVSKDITVSEMIHLRDEGMTHEQIANACGCSVGTVYKYIGKKAQKHLIGGEEMSKDDTTTGAVTAPVRAAPTAKPTATPQPPPRLLRQETVTLKGDDVVYTISLTDDTVEAKGSTFELMSNHVGLQRLIAELQEVDRELSRVAG